MVFVVAPARLLASEPLGFGQKHDATVDIPLDTMNDSKKREKELAVWEADLTRFLYFCTFLLIRPLNQAACKPPSSKPCGGLVGRGPQEILRLAEGPWYSKSRDIMMALYTLLRAFVLGQGLKTGLVYDIQKYLKDLINAGLRQRLIL